MSKKYVDERILGKSRLAKILNNKYDKKSDSGEKSDKNNNVAEESQKPQLYTGDENMEA